MEVHQVARKMNIFTSVRPLYILSKILGIFPMSPQGSVWKGVFAVKWHDFITPCINFAVSITIIVWCISLEDAASSSHFLSIIWILREVIAMILSTITFFCQISKFKLILKFLTDMDSFDKKVLEI